ncbi:hypothetical protein LCL90_01115 [Bacillus infantis]|nr:hypothetical protein [Bacillus infantis]
MDKIRKEMIRAASAKILDFLDEEVLAMSPWS